MGLKFTSLDMNINRLLSRGSSNSLADLVIYKKYFNYNLNICIPNMTIRQGQLTVFDKNTIIKRITNIRKKIKKYYNEDINKDILNNMITRCNPESWHIYNSIKLFDKDTHNIVIFHLQIKEQLFSNYVKKTNNLLDIGSGKLTDLKFWIKYNIKHIDGIEPSIESIKLGLKKLKDQNINNVDIINSIANVNWKNNKLFENIINKKYDIITFQYTLHYLISDIDLIIQNLLLVMQNKTKIIITCMDGDKIDKDLKIKKKIEIRNR